MKVCLNYHDTGCKCVGICGKYKYCPKELERALADNAQALQEVEVRLGRPDETADDINLAQRLGHDRRNLILCRETLKELTSINKGIVKI